MSDECFKNIINGSTGGLTTKLYHLRAATRSEKAKNWSSVVKDLVLAWNENLPSDIKRYEFLRHAVSHGKGGLHQSTINGLHDFGKDYLKLTKDGRFDYQANNENLRSCAEFFLAYTRKNVRDELQRC